MPTSSSAEPAPRDRQPSPSSSPSSPPPRGARRPLPVWAAGLALAIPLCVAYLLAGPPSADLAAATYRSDLFTRAGFTLWDNGWYSGHAVPAYSLLSPALGAWLGLRVLLALSAVVGVALYGAIAQRQLRRAPALASTLAFALGFCAELPSGRVPYDLGVAIGLATMLVFLRGPLPVALALAALTAAASPVAGAFVALGGVALAAGALIDARRKRSPNTPEQTGASPDGTRPRPAPGGPHRMARREGVPHEDAALRDAARGSALCAAGLLPILLLAALFPEGGIEPFSPGAFWPQLAAVLATAALLPRGTLRRRGWITIRAGAAIYALALIASFLLQTPVGGNAARLGALFGPPLIVAAGWSFWSPSKTRASANAPSGGRSASTGAPAGGDPRPAAAGHRPTAAGRRPAATGRRPAWPLALLALLVPLLLYWQLASSIDDQVALAGDPTVEASFYAPLRSELLSLTHRSPIRVEVPLTGAHWASAYLPGGPISIARGWERQLDVRYGRPFYGPSLDGATSVSPTAYKRWLSVNAISYVALPRARFDSAGRAEAQLIERGVPYLREVWRSRDWRLLEVIGGTPIAQRPARATFVGADSFAVYAPSRGRYLVHLHWTPYWSVSGDSGCVGPGRNGLTLVRARAAGTIRVRIDFSLSRLLGGGGSCGS